MKCLGARGSHSSELTDVKHTFSHFRTGFYSTLQFYPVYVDRQLSGGGPKMGRRSRVWGGGYFVCLLDNSSVAMKAQIAADLKACGGNPWRVIFLS